MTDSTKILNTAKEAALEAGLIHMQFFGKKLEISHKFNEYDLVTNVDRLSEEKIVSVIKKSFPDHNILGEEGTQAATHASDFTWVIDPIDGTTNYAHAFPQFSASIGILYKGELFMGVVYDAFKKEMFSAVKGQGAFLNDVPIRVSSVDTIEKSLLSTGFPYDREDVMKENLKYFESFVYKAQALRRPGSASLDLCYTACGRLDGFWELNLAPWDTAAGALIVLEAGGKVTNMRSDEFDIYEKSIIASNGLIHSQMQEIINYAKV